MQDGSISIKPSATSLPEFDDLHPNDWYGLLRLQHVNRRDPTSSVSKGVAYMVLQRFIYCICVHALYWRVCYFVGPEAQPYDERHTGYKSCSGR